MIKRCVFILVICVSMLIGESKLDADSATFADHLKEMVFEEQDRLDELVVGDENAPVTVVIYLSFTCNHCGKFHTTEFPKFKKKYIDTGRVKVYLRCYLDDPASLDAAMLARCLAHGEKSSSKTVLKNFEKIMQAIFLVQQQWFKTWESSSAGKNDENAEKIAKEFLDNVLIKLGYGKDRIEACKLKDQTQLEKAAADTSHKWLVGLMMEQKRATEEFRIEFVPAFVIYKNDKEYPIIYRGTLTADELAKQCGLLN